MIVYQADIVYRVRRDLFPNDPTTPQIPKARSLLTLYCTVFLLLCLLTITFEERRLSFTNTYRSLSLSSTVNTGHRIDRDAEHH